MIDRAAFPTAAAYLESLPRGLESFPDCVGLFDAYQGIGPAAGPVSDGALPPQVLAVLRGEHGPREWIPEVHGLCADMVLVDRLGLEAFNQWCYDDAVRLFSGPIIRHLMRLVSPTLVVMGAGSRWGAVHRGSQLQTEPSRKVGDRMQTTATLTSPAGLFPESFLRGLASSFRAGLDGAHGRETRVDFVALESGVARYEVSWAR